MIRLAPIRAHSGELLRLDLLRFVAAVGIMWHHSHEFFHPVAERAAISVRTQAMALFVDLFFVISGFVIAYVYAARIKDWPGFGRFMQRRVGRLIPLHWLTLLLAWLFWMLLARLGVGNDHPVDTSLACLARTAALTHAIVGCGANGISPNGQSWSISTEMLLYLLFPALCLLLRSRALIVAGIVGALALATWIAHRHGVEWDRVYAPLRGLPSFLFGMLLHRLREPLGRRGLGTVPAIAALGVLLVLMNVAAPQWLVLACVYGLATLAVAADMRGPPGPLVTLLAPLGQLTYSIYMWHGLIIIVMMNAVGDKLLHLPLLPMIGLAALCYGTIFAVSYLSWTLIETPARRWIDAL